jgi:hypothetical protein
MARRQPANVKEDEQSDTDLIVSSLNQVTTALRSANAQLAQLRPRMGASWRAEDAPREIVNGWADDPYSELVPSVTPSVAAVSELALRPNTNGRLSTAIVEAKPAFGRYPPGTPEFRYWLVEEALARGIAFWSDVLPAGTTWSTSNPMRVELVAPGADLNAFYRRADGLHFYRRSVAGREIFSADSADVVCHELGHAILDALKPQLFNAASTEASAFHESFGDMSAILSALQLDAMRDQVIRETQGRLNNNSRLSRLAEQLGWGIRQLSPSAVDPDSLRNAANRFFYRRPDELPSSAPSNLLSREPHSLSRVFTGAFLDALAEMFASTGSRDGPALLVVSHDMGQLLADAVHSASVASGYFSQVAAAMIQADRARFGAKYAPALNRAFVNRGILAVDAALALSRRPAPAVEDAARIGASMAETLRGASTVLGYENVPPDDAYAIASGETPELPRTSISIGDLTIEVHAPLGERLFPEARAAAMVGAIDPLDVDKASRTFVEGLIQRDEVDLGAAAASGQALGIASALTQAAPRPSKFTHALTTSEGRLVLKRSHFNCGCRIGGMAQGAAQCGS